MSEFKFEVGEYCEGLPWKLVFPYEDDSMGYVKLCRHAILQGTPVPKMRSDGSVYGHKQRYTLPKGVVQCLNEAGHNGTELCLECLDEARATVSELDVKTR